MKKQSLNFLKGGLAPPHKENVNLINLQHCTQVNVDLASIEVERNATREVFHSNQTEIKTRQENIIVLQERYTKKLEEISTFVDKFDLNLTQLKKDFDKYNELLTKQLFFSQPKVTNAIDELAAIESLKKRALQPMQNSVETTKPKPSVLTQTTKPKTTPAAISVSATFNYRTRGLTTQIKNDVPSVLSTELSPSNTISQHEDE